MNRYCDEGLHDPYVTISGRTSHEFVKFVVKKLNTESRMNLYISGQSR